MSLYTININDDVVTEQIRTIINDIFNRCLQHETASADSIIRGFIKEEIYSHKDEIIKQVVERAAREITKKSLPKLLERLDGER